MHDLVVNIYQLNSLFTKYFLIGEHVTFAVPIVAVTPS